MTALNYYQVLGVARDASPSDLRTAYARLVKRHHPDVDGELSARLNEIQHAYRCLSDAATRAEHDRLLADDERRHYERQRRVRHRLARYDRHHPPLPPLVWYRSWRLLLLIGSGTAAITWILAGLFGAEPG